MDLENFIANRELLERLSREYELLKASGANVDYPAWVRQRLREAASELAAKAISTPAADVEDSGASAADSAAPLHPEEHGEIAELPGKDDAVQTDAPTEQLSLARNPAANRLPRALHFGGVATGAEPAWFLHGEGTGTAASQALRTAIYGPAGPGLPSALATTKSTKKQKRVVIVSPRKSPAQRPPGASPYKPNSAASPHQRKQQQHPPAVAHTHSSPLSKLYAPVEPGLFAARPDAYVHPEAHPRRTSPASKRPDWVNAASLQAALRGAASAVPHLQAAAERERRLALSTALARQTLAAGLGADDARAVALYGTSPRATSAAHAQYDHVLQVAQLLARHNEQLARAVQHNTEQLAKQQQILESTLTRSPTKDAAAGGSDGVAVAKEPPAPQLEVEAGPPAWFTRRGPPGQGATAGGNGRGRSKSPAATKATKSPSKATQTVGRPRSATSQTAVGTTAKERERTTRKESLKALLKQVLDGAGLAGGREGRRRLASGMAEAEKLVAAIQTLAQIKKAKSRKGVQLEPSAPVASPARNMAASATQTSGPASADSEPSGGGEAPEAAAGAGPAGGGSQRRSRGGSGKQVALDSKESEADVGGGVPKAASVISRKGRAAGGPASRSPSRRVHSGSGEDTTSSEGGRRSPSPDPAAPDVAALAERPPRPPWARSTDESENSVPQGGRDGRGKSSSSGDKPSPGRDARKGAARTPSPSKSRKSFTYGERRSLSPDRQRALGSPSRHESREGTDAIMIPSSLPGRVPVAVTGALRGVPAGLMVDSLEDQVQQIVQRDAEAFAEAARLNKIDALEQRLHSLVDKVENKLAHALQPLQLNAKQVLSQQQQLQQLANMLASAQGDTGLQQLGPDGLSLRGAGTGGAAGRSGAGERLGAATGVVGAGGIRRGPGHGAGYTGHGDGAVSPRSAQMSVLELQRMLIQLNRMESKEQEIRRKWFHDTLGPRRTGPITRPIVVRDGQLGTLDPDEPSSPPQFMSRASASPTSPVRRSRSPSPPAGRGGTAYWSFAHPPTESALATVAADSTITRSVGVGGGRGAPDGGLAESRQARDGTAEADESLADPISDAVLESVLRGRKRFLRAQRLADGDLVAAAEPSLNPVQIVEDVADVLLDELLREQARELAGLCDSLGEHVVKDEFQMDSEDDDNSRLGARRAGLGPKRFGDTSRGLR